MQAWDRTWTDAELYRKYGISKEEIGFVEAMIRPMGEGDE
jgi:site-specific DNA-methyltransferase (adenine-specific)